jgi:hypothetical protein
MLPLIDTLRQIEGDGLERLGFGPTECGYGIVAGSARWRLRTYEDGATGPSLLIVATPIKRPYIWDLAEGVSVVRRCLRHRLRVYLLEWMPPTTGDAEAGLADYAGRSIGEATARVARGSGRGKTLYHEAFARWDIGGDFRGVRPVKRSGSRSAVDTALLCAGQLPVPGCHCCDGAIHPLEDGDRSRFAVIAA